MPSFIAASPPPRNQDSIIQNCPMYQYKHNNNNNNNNNNLTLEIQLVWNVKTKAIRLKIRVTGTIAKSAKHIWRARTRTKHTWRARTRTRNYKKQPHWALHTYFGNNMTCIISRKYKIAATLYSLETWFVSGM